MNTIFISACLLLSSALYSQQTGSVNGQIFDEALNNEPLVLATVVLKSSGQVCKTNFHGKFSISGILSGVDTLVVTHPGYETLKIVLSIPEGRELAIEKSMNVLMPDLDEVNWSDIAKVTGDKTLSRQDK